ncbi:hypothetical protein Pfo_010381 [Paulownia fortunei]|nr:hypothetical protein Pfo_010381 [Paulownia fortunei]
MGSQELSLDIIFEILTRTTSLKTLDACKCVCKGWKQLIYESSFMPLYCKKTNNLSGYFIQDVKLHMHVSMFVSIDQSEGGGGGGCIASLPHDMRILASCNQGILCCLRRKDRGYRYYTSKPATRQWQALPNPKLRYQTAAVAIMVLRSSPLRYKIVRLSELDFVEDYCRMRCEIFDSEIWTWRETQGLNLPHTEIIIGSHPAVSAGNSVHWLTDYDNVLAFHEAEESFDKFCLPEPAYKNYAYKHKRLVEYQGRLGFSCLLAEDGIMELWLTDGPRNYQWTKKMAVNIASLERSVKYPSPVGFYNGEIAFIRTLHEVIFYKLQDSSFTKVELDFDLRYAHEYFQFRSDLEPVSLKGSR